MTTDDENVKPAPTNDPAWQYANDIFTTALEGGIGYWSECSAYRWDREDFYAVIHENDGTTHRIDRAVIEKGLALYNTEANKGNRIGRVIKSIESLGEEGDFDAWDADTVVQLALFGEVVYG